MRLGVVTIQGIAFELDSIPAIDTAVFYQSADIRDKLDFITVTHGKGAIESRLIVLSDDGVVFGTTVLGYDVELSRAEKSAPGLYKRVGILFNFENDAESLEAILRRYFSQYSVQIKGRCIAFFEVGRTAGGTSA